MGKLVTNLVFAIIFSVINVKDIVSDGDNDVPSVPNIEQERLPRSGLHGGFDIEMRPTRIAKMCKDLDVNGKFSRLLPAVSTSYNFYNRSSICACTVPKAASTSIKRSLFVSEYPHKADFFRNLPGYIIHTQVNVQNVTRDVCFTKSTTSFMVTRDPFTRLYSAYIDKIFLEKFHKYTAFIDLVLNKGVTMEEIAEMEEIDDDRLNQLYCRMTNVSFEQFLETIAKAKRLDIHFAPASVVCKPCSNHFDIVVKQENLSSDLHYLHKTIYSSQKPGEYLSNYVGESGIESLVVSYYSHWKARLSKHKCNLDKNLYNSINKRLWNALKLLGNIDENLEFIEELFKSPSGEKLKLRKPETILYEFKANHIPVLDKESRERQRNKYLEQVYQGIDKKVIRKIQRLFYLDFKLFDYNPVPPGL